MLAVGVGALMLECALIVQNSWTPLRGWPEGSFVGFMAATVWAIVPFVFGAMSLLRVAGHKMLALACLISGALSLAMSAYLISL
jgi:hypothetical protein